MGHQMTSFSCIGKGQPYGTQIIKSGIDGLINKVVESFGITKEKAYELINVYGIDKRDISLAYRGSSNQRIIDVKKTTSLFNLRNKIYLWKE